MKREKRQPSRRELAAATSRRAVVRRIQSSSAADRLTRKRDITANNKRGG